MKGKGDLNFLSNQTGRGVDARTKKKAIVFTVGLLAAWVLMIVSVYGAYSYFKKDYEATAEEYKKILAEYQLLADKVTATRKLKYRVKAIGGVLDERFEYGKAFKTVNSLFPSEIGIETVELKGGGTFMIAAQTKDREMINWLEKEVERINKQKRKEFSRAGLKSLEVSDENWKFTVEVVCKKWT